jgi:hypothetical protein
MAFLRGNFEWSLEEPELPLGFFRLTFFEGATHFRQKLFPPNLKTINKVCF